MSSQLIIICAGILGLGGLTGVAYVLYGGAAAAKDTGLRNLMPSGASRTAMRRASAADALDLTAEDILRRKSKAQGKAEELSRKLFRAGYFTSADRAKFARFRIISLVVAAILIPVALRMLTPDVRMVGMGALLGALIGFSLPLSLLEKMIRRREEDIMFYLPLVIEQVSIGVSSALDIGPCLSQIVTMAGERDSHNPVTEMFVHVEKLMRSGLNLENSLTEVAEANGMVEVKHAFLFLAQCAKHGGEISKQLQELADSVMIQRQVQIEGKITALPVKATGPLAMVFAGFFALLFAGLLVRLMSAFGM